MRNPKIVELLKLVRVIGGIHNHQDFILFHESLIKFRDLYTENFSNLIDEDFNEFYKSLQNQFSISTLRSTNKITEDFKMGWDIYSPRFTLTSYIELAEKYLQTSDFSSQ